MSLGMDFHSVSSNYQSGIGNIFVKDKNKNAAVDKSFISAMQNTDRQTEFADVYAKLSDRSKELLSKLKKNESITESDWTYLGQNLLDVGAISKQDFDLTRADLHLVPLPKQAYTNNGVCFRISYNNTDDMPKYLNRRTTWNGSPLDYLDQWINDFRNMQFTKDDMGRFVYDSETLDKYIDADKNVSEVLKKLLEMF